MVVVAEQRSRRPRLARGAPRDPPGSLPPRPLSDAPPFLHPVGREGMSSPSSVDMIENPPVLNFEEIDYKEIEVEEVRGSAMVGRRGKARPWGPKRNSFGETPVFRRNFLGCLCVCISDPDLKEMSTRDIGGER